MQITGRPSRLSSFHSHVAVAPVSRPIRTAPGALDLTNEAIASGSDHALSYDRSRVVHHTDRGPLQRHVQSDIVFHRRSPSLQGLWGWPDCFWRADSQSLNMARSRNYPMLKKDFEGVLEQY